MTRSLLPALLLTVACGTPEPQRDTAGIPNTGGVPTGLILTIERNGVVEAQYNTDLGEGYYHIPADTGVGCDETWFYSTGDQRTISFAFDLPNPASAGHTTTYTHRGMLMHNVAGVPPHIGASADNVRIDVWDDYRQFTLQNAAWCDTSTTPATCGPYSDTVVVTVETTTGDPWQVPGPTCFLADHVDENQWFAGATTPMCSSSDGTPCP